MTHRQDVIDLIDEMTEDELRAMTRYAHYLRHGDATDPVSLLLDNAPIDDEPTTEDEDRQAEEGWQAYLRGEAVSLDEVRRRLPE